MLRKTTLFVFLFLSSLLLIASTATAYSTPANYIQTPESQASLTPNDALRKLLDGNNRFLRSNMRNRDYALQLRTTAQQGQAPFAVILSCMDSRGAPEIIFDQGIGDIFSLRVAGNILNQDNIASMEYGTQVLGSKVVLVMGHTHCGAVDAACHNVELGNVTSLLEKIRPAVSQINKSNKTCDATVVNAIAKQNVLNIVKNIPTQSTILSQLIKQKKLIIVGAMHDLDTGKVTFFGEDGQNISN